MTTTLTHYCPADGTREVDAEYRADAEEYRGECDECGNAVYGVDGREHP
jgi:hypothetical protein